MIIRLLCLFLIFISSSALCQGKKDSLDLGPRKLLDLSFETEKIDIDGEGNILLISSINRQVYKLFKEFGFDSLISIGGASARDEALFHPIELRSNTRQRIYVLDDVGQKVVLLNTNLKVLQTFNFALLNAEREEGSDIFPIAIDLSPTGEMLVLNQWDNSILRFSNQLNPNGVFGGTNYGEGSLFQPIAIEVSTKQQVFVFDAQQKKVLVYSLYGIFQYAIPLEEIHNCNRMRIVDNYLMILDGQSVLTYHLPTERISTRMLQKLPKILDFTADRQYFYFLSGKEIYISPRSD